MQGIKIKPLVWTYVGGETWIARTTIGIASVQKDTHGWGVWLAGQNSESVCWRVENTIEAAKAAAQADYDARILAALEWKTTVSPEVQALVDDGRPCASDLFLVALFDQINNVHDREYFIKAWLEGDWECATSEITIGAAK